jgi:alkylated DNA repair dioxygenase AlkB
VSAVLPVQSLGEGAWVTFVPDFIPNPETVFRGLLEELPLKVETLRMGAREVATPRETSWHGDPGCRYRYSGRDFEPQPFTPRLAELRGLLKTALGVDFNTVLANHYRDGRDAMGWHADDEPELGPRAPDDVLIASLSLGAARRFVMKPKRARGRTGERWSWALGGGSLLVMGGTCQRLYAHAVPRTAQPVGPRLNLTFRIVQPV